MNSQRKTSATGTPCNRIRSWPSVWLMMWLVSLVAGPIAIFAQVPLSNPLQTDNRQHYLYDNTLPPGEIAQRRLLKRMAMLGYFQPIRLVGPQGAKVEVFSEGAFQSSEPSPPLVGMMVGHIYRLKITGIPNHAGKELFPSVEIIDRLYPPSGREVDCPVPVHIPLEDLEPAMAGRLVTRVVYLENPQTALPEQQSQSEQPYFDVGVGDDPIRVAEKFGRPMVIVRIGSRVPDQQELNGFGFGTPPFQWIDQAQRPQTQPKTDDLKTQGLPSSFHNVGYQKPSADPASSPTLPQSSIVKKILPNDRQCPVCGVQDCQVCQRTETARTPHSLPPAGPPIQLPPSRDEMLMDGGDRGFKTTVTDQWEIRGLDSEDTIGHFDTLDGRRIVDESNQVAIYAPRFAAVRKIDGVGRTKFSQLTRRLGDQTGTKSARRSDFSTTTLQNLQAARHKAAHFAGGLENQTRGVLVDNTTILKRFNRTFKSYENFRLMRTGIYDNREKGRLAIAMDRAGTWQTNLSAQATVDNLQLILVGDARAAQETIHIKTEADRPKLRLVKIASRDLAHPGDIVEFTIRFDNAGDSEIGNVTIMDSLTARLEYIPGTAECSLPAKFLTTANSVQSKILRWEIEDPLQVGQGGVIRFQCRVR